MIWQSCHQRAENSAAYSGCHVKQNNCLQRQGRIWQQNSKLGCGAQHLRPCSPSGTRRVLQPHQLQGPCVLATLPASPGSRQTCCALPSPFQQMLCRPRWVLCAILDLRACCPLTPILALSPSSPRLSPFIGDNQLACSMEAWPYVVSIHLVIELVMALFSCMHAPPWLIAGLWLAVCMLEAVSDC